MVKLPTLLLGALLLTVAVDATPLTGGNVNPGACKAFGVPQQQQQRMKRNHRYHRRSSSSSTTTVLPPSSSSSSSIPRGGGQVVEPSSLDEVEAILIKAGSENSLVVIDFSATWCGPCQAIAPWFKELSEMYDDVVFLKVDVDENPDTAAKYSVSAMPTFVFIKSGDVVDRLMGANAPRLQELIEEYRS